MVTAEVQGGRWPRLIQAAIDAFSLPDLRTKILFTLALLAVFRLMAQVPIPGINNDQLVSEGNTGQGTLDRTRIVKRQHVGRDWSHTRARLTEKSTHNRQPDPNWVDDFLTRKRLRLRRPAQYVARPPVRSKTKPVLKLVSGDTM